MIYAIPIRTGIVGGILLVAVAISSCSPADDVPGQSGESDTAMAADEEAAPPADVTYYLVTAKCNATNDALFVDPPTLEVDRKDVIHFAGIGSAGKVDLGVFGNKILPPHAGPVPDRDESGKIGQMSMEFRVRDSVEDDVQSYTLTLDACPGATLALSSTPEEQASFTSPRMIIHGDVTVGEEERDN